MHLVSQYNNQCVLYFLSGPGGKNKHPQHLYQVTWQKTAHSVNDDCPFLLINTCVGNLVNQVHQVRMFRSLTTHMYTLPSQTLTWVWVDTYTGVSLVEQYTTVDEYLRAGCFDPKVLVNCLQLDPEHSNTHTHTCVCTLALLPLWGVLLQQNIS